MWAAGNEVWIIETQISSFMSVTLIYGQIPHCPVQILYYWFVCFFAETSGLEATGWLWTKNNLMVCIKWIPILVLSSGDDWFNQSIVFLCYIRLFHLWKQNKTCTMAMRICYHQLTQSLSARSRTKTTLRLVFLTSAFEHKRACLCKSLRLFKLHHKQSVSQPRSVPCPHTRCMIHLHKAAKHYKNIMDAQINTFKKCIRTYILHSTAS